MSKLLSALVASSLLLACAADTEDANGTQTEPEGRIEIAETAGGRVVRSYDDNDVLRAEFILRDREVTLIRDGSVRTIPMVVEPAKELGAVNLQASGVTCDVLMWHVRNFCTAGGTRAGCHMASVVYLTNC